MKTRSLRFSPVETPFSSLADWHSDCFLFRSVMLQGKSQNESSDGNIQKMKSKNEFRFNF